VAHASHVPPGEHRDFYTGQRFTLNVTRAVMREAGWSPSVRLFEAAACATPIVSDRWPGLETLLEPGREVLVADETSDVDRLLRGMNEDERRAIGRAARERVLREHTAAHRAEELENHVLELLDRSVRRARTAAPRVTREEIARRGES
jgi:spore maturation protein CgeB